MWNAARLLVVIFVAVFVHCVCADLPHFFYSDVSSDIDVNSDNSGLHEGVHHGKNNIPNGARLVSLPVGNEGAKLAAYLSKNNNDAKTTNVYVMMHGRLRDGDNYWTIMNNALKDARNANFSDVPENAIVVAPQMYSKALNKGQYSQNTLAWAELNTWEAGLVAANPSGTNLTSMDALDAVVDYFSSKRFPSMRNITMVGHGGGAQLMNRYAATGEDPPNRKIHIRYVVGDPSSSPYFTTDRPMSDTNVVHKASCNGYNEWRYGFDNFPGTRFAKMMPVDYFGRYVNRDVVNMVGLNDVLHNGDQHCMAILQGGHKRRDRNLSWWRYIHMLARSNENLDGFPGNFSNLPDWSRAYKGINTRLAVVPDAGHSAKKVFGSDIGRSVLFSNGDVTPGWRPGSGSGKSSSNTSSSSKSSSSKSSSSKSSNKHKHNNKHSNKHSNNKHNN